MRKRRVQSQGLQLLHADGAAAVVVKVMEGLVYHVML